MLSRNYDKINAYVSYARLKVDISGFVVRFITFLLILLCFIWSGILGADDVSGVDSMTHRKSSWLCS